MNEYLVVWYANDTDTPGIERAELEIFGQRLDDLGVDIGENDFQISDAGGVDSTNVSATRRRQSNACRR